MTHTAALVRGLACEHLKLPERLTVSEWADRNRVLSQKSAAEPGPWRTSRTPYLREIMDCLSARSPVEDVTFMAGSQIGKTEGLGNNWIGYVIDHAPGPMMMVLPTMVLAKRHSKTRIQAMLDDTPSLAGRVRQKKSRDSGNTMDLKEFPGGLLVLTGANSAAGLKSTPVKWRCYDEVDEYPADVDGQGDPIELGEVRGRTFARGKCVKVSSPTQHGSSRIESSYEASDQRHYFVPCPHCQFMQVLKWSQVKWEKDETETAHYVCEECAAAIEEHHKTWMLAHGQWVPKYPERKARGYHLSALYSPLGWFSWSDAVAKFVDAGKNQEKLKVFVNTVLAETWKEQSEVPDWQRLYDRREHYKTGMVPAGGLLLTCGVDVQKDRIEAEVVAWGPGLETWSVDYEIFEGSPTEAKVWAALTEYLNRRWPHESGAEMVIERTAVDSGYETQHVYAWARKQPVDRVMVIKGSDTASVPVGQPSAVDVGRSGKRIRRGLKVWPVGVRVLKSELYGWLRLDRPTEESGDPYPAGYCHFPMYDDEAFQQLTAEHIVMRLVKGYRKYIWEKKRERNERLDCRVYARAAATRLGIDHFREGHWEQRRAALAPVEQAERPEENLRGRLTIRSKYMDR